MEPTPNDHNLTEIGTRFKAYTDARATRPSHEEIAEVVHTAIFVEGRDVGAVATALNMHRTQLNRDYGWAWIHTRGDAPAWWDTNRTKESNKA